MKILHILSQVPSATGSGIYLQAAMRHAARQGFENILLAGVPVDFEQLDIEDLGSDRYHPVQFGRDIPFPVVGMSDVMPYPSTRFCDLSPHQLELYCTRFEKKLEEAVEGHGPDLIHSHHLWLLTSLAKQKYPRIPMITSCHGSDLRQFHSCPHLQPLVLPGCRRVETVCALSTIQKLEIEQLYQIDPERIEVIGAGYEPRRFYPPDGLRPDAPLQILYAGKLSRAKGVPWLLKALLRLSHRQFVLHLAGHGHGIEKDEIIRLARQLGSKVRIHGNLDQDRLAALMRQSDLFVLPSFFEGLPLVLMEALACGCHLIATALPGVSELFAEIESDWIELIDLPAMIAIDKPHPADEEHFVDTLVAALNNQARRFSVDGRQPDCPGPLRKLLERHTWEGVFTRLEKLYSGYG